MQGAPKCTHDIYLDNCRKHLVKEGLSSPDIDVRYASNWHPLNTYLNHLRLVDAQVQL